MSSPQAPVPATTTVRSRAEPLSPPVATPLAAVSTPAVIVANSGAAPAAEAVKSDGAAAPAAQTTLASPPDSAPLTEEDGPTLEVREIEVPKNRKRAQIKLTLLDGTTIKVPSGRKRRGDAAPESSSAPPSGEPELTAADLVAALRAAAHGADAADVLGTNLRWEKMMAALLTLLLRKHLIFERELIEELKKI
jgi:hypothetical protein